MTRMWFPVFLFCLANQAMGQAIFTVDTLMKKKHIKTKTQYECDKTGKDCKTLYQHRYDVTGRLVTYIEFSGNEPFLTTCYHYNSFNKADTVSTRFSGQAKYVSQVYLFDSIGNITEYRSCFEKSGCSTTEKYLYDKAGRLTVTTKFRNGKPDTKTSYTYSETGNNTKTVTQYISYRNETLEVNEFDEKHQKIKSISYDKKAGATDSTKYSYDSNGNLLSLNRMGGLGTKSLYTYDADGNETEYRSVTLDGKINDHRIMTYKDDLIQSRIHYDGQFVKYFFKFGYGLY